MQKSKKAHVLASTYLLYFMVVKMKTSHKAYDVHENGGFFFKGQTIKATTDRTICMVPQSSIESSGLFFLLLLAASL